MMNSNDPIKDIGYDYNQKRYDYDIPLYARFSNMEQGAWSPSASVAQTYSPPTRGEKTLKPPEEVKAYEKRHLEQTKERFRRWDMYAKRAIHPSESVFYKMKDMIKNGCPESELIPFWK